MGDDTVATLESIIEALNREKATVKELQNEQMDTEATAEALAFDAGRYAGLEDAARIVARHIASASAGEAGTAG